MSGADLRDCDAQTPTEVGRATCRLRYDHAGGHDGYAYALGRAFRVQWSWLYAGLAETRQPTVTREVSEPTPWPRHHMTTWPNGRATGERVCPHGVGHSRSLHGCDGCCIPPEETHHA